MDSMLQPPSATAFDAASAAASAALYVLIAVAGVLRAPRDRRTHLFLLIAVCGAPPYLLSLLLWARGTAALTRPVIVTAAVSLALGSLALLHFTQLFPWRRPWIRGHWRWLLAGYILLPVMTAVLATRITALLDVKYSSSPGDYQSFSELEAPLMVLALIPTLFTVGIVVPFCGLMSLFKSWQTAKAARMEGARITTQWMLISQLAGGVLTILVVPLLHLVAPTGPWVTIAAALLFAFGLAMPIAFAAGIWKYRVLDIDPEWQPDERRIHG
jgi:uncharacterized membrane protein